MKLLHKYNFKKPLMFLIIISAISIFADRLPSAEKDNKNSQKARTLVRAYDGDTIELDKGEKVRILNINAPETWEKKNDKWVRKKNADPRGIKAYEFLRSFEGKKVRLSFDKEKKDKYERTLAHVYAIDEGIDLGAELIRRGWADVLIIPPNFKRAKEYRALEKEAKEKKK
ncbi:MAG: thermonuclease family protein [Planctomycetota bacterium]|jgi:micrococcal nuclease